MTEGATIMPMPEGEIVTITDDEGFTITSNSATREQLLALNKPEKPATDDVVQVDDKGRARAEDGKFRKVNEPNAEPEESAEPEKAKEPEKADAKPEAKPEPKPEEKRPSRAQERIRELIQERKTLERELAAAREAKARLEGRMESPAPAAPKAAPQGEPQESDFETYAEYTRAVAKWEAKQLLESTRAEEHAQVRAREYAASIDKAVARFSESIEKAGGKEFVSSLPEELQSLRPSFTLDQEKGEEPGPMNALADEVVAAPDSALMLRYLAEHPDVLRRFSKPLHPMQFAREMGKIEAALATATTGTPVAAPPRYEPKARGPVTPVTGAPTAAEADLDPDTTPLDEWVRAMNAREARVGRR